MATADVAAPTAGAPDPHTHNAQIPNREANPAHDQTRGQPIIGATDFIAQLPQSTITNAIQRALPVINPDAAVDPDFNGNLTDDETDKGSFSENESGGIKIEDWAEKKKDKRGSTGSGTIFAAANTREPDAGRRHKIKSLKDKTKAAIKDGLHSGAEKDGEVGDDIDGATNGPSRGRAAIGKDPKPDGAYGQNEGEPDNEDNHDHDHEHHRVRNLLHKVVHPKQTVKGAVMSGAGQEVGEIAKNGVDRETDLKWVEAHDKKEKAIEEGDQDEVAKADETIEQLTQKRRAMQLRMVVRQIDKVQAVRITPMKLPTKEDYVIRDENGEIKRDQAGIVQYDWILYAGEVGCSIAVMVTILTFSSSRYITPNRGSHIMLKIGRIQGFDRSILTCSGFS